MVLNCSTMHIISGCIYYLGVVDQTKISYEFLLINDFIHVYSFYIVPRRKIMCSDY